MSDQPCCDGCGGEFDADESRYRDKEDGGTWHWRCAFALSEGTVSRLRAEVATLTGERDRLGLDAHAARAVYREVMCERNEARARVAALEADLAAMQEGVEIERAARASADVAKWSEANERICTLEAALREVARCPGCASCARAAAFTLENP